MSVSPRSVKGSVNASPGKATKPVSRSLDVGLQEVLTRIAKKTLTLPPEKINANGQTDIKEMAKVCEP